jgi:hypothetical protein
LNDTLKLLNLDLTETERDILYEYTRAREVMEVLGMPGWLHIQDLMDSKVSTIEEKYLEVRNIKPEALFAYHVAIQFMRDFVKAVKAQLATTGDWLRDPAAIQAMLDRANAVSELDLEGELPNPLNPLPTE